MKREFSAGGAVFKKVNNNYQWLVIKPRPSKAFPKERYQLPKGKIDPGENAKDTAIREVLEETGIEGRLLEKVADSKIFYNFNGEKIFKIISYYLMEYVSGEPKENAEVEKIFWLPLPEAVKKLTYSNDKAVLKKAEEILTSLLVY